MDAVIRLIERGGWEALTLKGVGAEAGVSTGIVAHYFGAKDAMVADAIRDAYRRFSNDALAAVDTRERPLEKLIALVDRVVMESVPSWAFWIEMWGKMPFDATIRHELTMVYRQYTMLVAGILRAAVADGSITKDINPDRCADLFVALIDGLGMRSELGQGEMEPERQRSLLFQFWSEQLDMPEIGASEDSLVRMPTA